MYGVTTNLYRLWGSNLKRQREFKEISRAEMAEALETSEATISRWEAGIVMPNDERKIEVADFLGVPAVTIFPLQRMPS